MAEARTNGSVKTADLLRSRLLEGEELNPTDIGNELGISTSYLQVMVRQLEREGHRFVKRRIMVDGAKRAYYQLTGEPKAKPIPKEQAQIKANKRSRKQVRQAATRSASPTLPDLGASLTVVGLMLDVDDGTRTAVMQDGKRTWIVSVVSTHS